MASGIVGGLVTSLIASLWLEPLLSLALAPLGGSFMALAAAILVATRQSDLAYKELPALATTDAQVKALREIAARGRMASTRSAGDPNSSERAA